MLEIAILGILADRDLHGYEIRKLLIEDGLLMSLSFGTLYPALARLEKAGAVESFSQSSPITPAQATGTGMATRMPLTGSLTGERAAAGVLLRPPTRSTRGKKVYQLTKYGRELFEKLLNDDSGVTDRRSFDIRLAFARHLSPTARLRLLERRKSHVATTLERIEAISQQPKRSQWKQRYENLVIEHDIESMQQDLAWLDNLIQKELDASQAASDNGQLPAESSIQQ
ncbi:MAG: PadR family transcriptional regulator [Actinobacteria bacterium]|nr:PadR family transcriptional regulator [Actinomycetota bacterium]MCL5886631.1 PadR family transcriptional regulator [Actinomycetota bacterium]